MALTFERASELLAYEPDSGLLRWRVARRGRGRIQAGSVAGYICARSGYRVVMVDGQMHRQHRIAVLLMSGVVPLGEVDHMNGVKSDNRWTNLREVDHSTNQQNRHRKTKKRKHHDAPFGVEVGDLERPRPYKVRLWIGGKRKSFGSFSTAIEAEQVAVRARREHYGGFVG